MRRKNVSAVTLAIAVSFSGSVRAFDAPAEPDPEPSSQQSKTKGAAQTLPVLGGIPPAGLIAAGLAAAAALAAGSGGGGGGGSGSGSTPVDSPGGGSTSSAPPPAPPARTLSYTSAADFRTAEFDAQRGLGIVKADRLYYKGHLEWYAGRVPDPAAGTGVGIKIAVADTGINAREASSAGSIAIDPASYDYVGNVAASGTDMYGHGTHVAGIIAAPKNGAGMHGLAYNATIVNFKVGDAQITASDAQLADMMQRAANAGAMVINNSWTTRMAITSVSAQDLHAQLPRWIEASRAYVAAGGVVVFSAGNEGAAQPAMQPGMPYRISGLQPGWLAVVAVDGAGRITEYSNRCGVAALWCLAAPGGASNIGLYSMHNNGDYAYMYGTSMAAPHASAALGALKSMFPNLTYLQLRERLLFTANRTGPYADTSTYGQGLMDLDAASSPVGGVSVPTEASAEGATAPVTQSGVQFPAGALQALRMQGVVLVVDNYQRAPFWVPAETFFRESAPRLIERQWASLRSNAQSGMAQRGAGLRLSYSQGLNSAVSTDLAGYRMGFARGAGGEAILGSHLELAWLPQLAAPGVDSVALGYASEAAGLRIGLLGTWPAPNATSERTLEASSLGSRRAFSFIVQQRLAATTYGVSFATAEDFERPIGLAASGAFGLGASGALSTGTFVEHALDGKTTLKAALEVARHRAAGGATLTTPAYAMHSASFGARTLLGARTAVSAELRREWNAGEAAQLHVPLTIAENGAIGRVTYALPYDELLGRTALTLRVDHEITRRVDLRASLTHERYGFGVSVTGVAAMLEIAN